MESVKPVCRILERRRVGGMRAHPSRELVDGDSYTEINDIADKVAPVDFGRIDLNDCPILCNGKTNIRLLLK